MTRSATSIGCLILLGCGAVLALTAARSEQDSKVPSKALAPKIPADGRRHTPWEIERGFDSINPPLSNVPPDVQVALFDPRSGQWFTARRAEVKSGQQFYVSECLCTQGSDKPLLEIFPWIDRVELDEAYRPLLQNRPSRRPLPDDFVFVLPSESGHAGFRPLALIAPGERFRFRGKIYSAQVGSRPEKLRITDTGEVAPAFGVWLEEGERAEMALELDLSEGKGEFIERLLVPADDMGALANGSSKRMSELVKGDRIETSEGLIAIVTEVKKHVPEREPANLPPPPPGTSYERVIGWVKRTTDTLLYLHTTSELIKTTPEHPFSVVEKGWVKAADLQKGDRIATLDKKTVEVVSTEIRHERETVYNLRVEGSNTFYVGQNMLLVHNGGPCVPEVKLLNPPIRITPKGLQHILDRHSVNQLAKFKGKSMFNAGENIQELISNGVQQRMVLQANGRYARTFDVGRLIGWDRTTNAQTSIMTIITELDGTLVTAFPGMP